MTVRATSSPAATPWAQPHGDLSGTVPRSPLATPEHPGPRARQRAPRRPPLRVSPLAPRASRRLADVALEAALRRERRLLARLLDPATAASVGYTVSTPTRAEVDRGRTNCSTFVEAVLRDAGYRVDGPMPGIAGVAVADVINIRAERGQLADGQVLSAVLPELLDAGPQAPRLLADLVARRDPRTSGVALALSSSGQGQAVTSRDDVRPGDVVQTWRLTYDAAGVPVAARGHVTFVHRVHAVDLRTGRPVTLDATSRPSARPLRVTAVELLGSHLPAGVTPDATGLRRGRTVFTAPPIDLASFDRWYAVRPSRSPWVGR